MSDVTLSRLVHLRERIENLEEALIEIDTVLSDINTCLRTLTPKAFEYTVIYPNSSVSYYVDEAHRIKVEFDPYCTF